MRRITQDIKENNIQRAYLLYGVESYLRNQYRDNLLNALTTEGDTMNVSKYQGKNLPILDIIDFARTMPFLADRRVVLIEDSGLFTSESAGDELAEFIKKTPETCCFIFSEEDVNKKQKMYRAVTSVGYAAECSKQTPDDLRKWVASRMKKENLGITPQALDEFMFCAGDNMMMIQAEMEKLIAYAYGKDGINLEDVQTICTPRIDSKIFDMLDQIMWGRADKALELYGDLLALRVNPNAIMAQIESQIKNTILCIDMSYESKSVNDMAKVIGFERKVFAVNKMLRHGDKVGRKKFVKWLEMCADTVVATRTGKLDSQVGVELIIISMANEAKL